jgi:ATP-dependent Clp protease protease subunit
MNPLILEKNNQNLVALDLPSKLLQSRIIFLSTDVNWFSSSSIVSQILYLVNQSKEKITIYINSPGGSVYDGLGIRDMIEWAKNKGVIVETIVVGLAASMGALLASSGTKKYRKALPSSSLMVHQPSGGTDGTVTDMKIHIAEADRLKSLLNTIMTQNTGNPDIVEQMERDKWLTPQQAIDLGLIDEICY